MKLILANNQGKQFRAFYDELKQQSSVPFDYAGYESLLFEFDTTAAQPITVRSVATGRSLTEYDGVYLNGYMNTYELAATTATCCQALGIAFVDQELADAPSLSKLTAHAKLARAGVTAPYTLAGTKVALEQASAQIATLTYPLVLKRANADRGVDNFKVYTASEISDVLRDQPPRSIWLLQAYIENTGFYRINFYNQQPAFCVFRDLEVRPDGNVRKAHMFKPKDGHNAQLLELNDVPPTVLAMSGQAMSAMNRQIGGVDCIYDPTTDAAYVLEVNYNPQLVTSGTFQEIRVQAFLDGIAKIA